MRWLVALAFVLALGTLRLVGCGEEPPECRVDEDCGSGFCISGVCAECLSAEHCDDQNECTTDRCVSCEDWSATYTPGERLCCYNLSIEERCQDCSRPWCDLDSGPGYVQGVCVGGSCEENPCDDGNVCTDDQSYADGSCENQAVSSIAYPCDWNGEPGVCLDGVCQENICLEVVCDDGDTCTRGECDYRDGTCHFFVSSHNGKSCSSSNLPSGICIDGVCQEDLCPEMVCDDGDLCTTDYCTVNECHFTPTSCHDDNDCTEDSCDPETGHCSYPPVVDGTPCCGIWLIPGLLCLSVDACQDGQCI